MGIKRYKGYSVKKEFNNERINKIRRNINYIILLLILANLYLLPKYLEVLSGINQTEESIPVIEIDEGNDLRLDEANKINFISEGIDVITGDYKDNIANFQLSEDQLIINYKDEEGIIAQNIDKLIEDSSILKVTDIELLQNSDIEIRMVRSYE